MKISLVICSKDYKDSGNLKFSLNWRKEIVIFQRPQACLENPLHRCMTSSCCPGRLSMHYVCRCTLLSTDKPGRSMTRVGTRFQHQHLKLWLLCINKHGHQGDYCQPWQRQSALYTTANGDCTALRRREDRAEFTGPSLFQASLWTVVNGSKFCHLYLLWNANTC